MTTIDDMPAAWAEPQLAALRRECAEVRAERDALRAERDALRAERDGLLEAMRSRAVIEQAKGVLMERHGIDAEVAFGRLRTESQRRNVRLAVLAETLTSK